MKDEHGKDFVFKIWEANCKWVERIDSVLQKIGNIDLPQTIIWKWNLADLDYASEVPNVPSFDKLKRMVSSSSESTDTSITINTKLQKGYAFGFHQEGNDAERVLVSNFLESLVSSVNFSSGESDVLSAIKKEIFISPDIKHIHMFVAQGFRDRVSKSLPSPVLADEVDIANIKMGLGWLARKPSLGNELNGKIACTSYLRE